MSEVLIYETESGQTQVNVRLDAETVWLTQRQMAELLDTSADNISLHLKNIFVDGELDEAATTEDFSAVQIEGARSVFRRLKHYNLDAIISVGYRVNSKRGTQFRQWATCTLREHLVQGYTLNSTRLAERGVSEAQQAIELLARTLSNQELVNDTGREVLELVVRYAKTWRLLLEYDEDRLSLPSGCQPARGVLDYGKAMAAIAQIKHELIECGERLRHCSGKSVARLCRAYSAALSRRCSVNPCTALVKRRLRICCILSSRIIRFQMGINASAHFCFCFISSRRAWR